MVKLKCGWVRGWVGVLRRSLSRADSHHHQGQRYQCPHFSSSPAAATHSSNNNVYSLDSLLNTVLVSCPAMNLLEEARRRFSATQLRHECLTLAECINKLANPTS